MLFCFPLFGEEEKKKKAFAFRETVYCRHAASSRMKKALLPHKIDNYNYVINLVLYNLQLKINMWININLSLTEIQQTKNAHFTS